MDTIEKRWQALNQRVAEVGQKSPLGRSCTIIAVSKGQSADAIEELLKAGHRVFGENRVQEAEEKWPKLRALYPECELHLIGTLQSNKAKEALSLYNVIHTIDRNSLVDALVKARDLGHGGICREFFVQVNTGEEPQKGGVAPSELAQLIKYIGTSLPLTGLMCVPPANEVPAPHFALLSKLAQEFGLPNLSMGMSSDYETAVRLGATHIRVGTAIFGQRDRAV